MTIARIAIATLASLAVQLGALVLNPWIFLVSPALVGYAAYRFLDHSNERDARVIGVSAIVAVIPFSLGLLFLYAIFNFK